MKNKKLIRFVSSLVLLPMFSMSSPSQMVETPNMDIFSYKQEDPAVKLKNDALEAKALAIDTYFDKYDMPLSGTGMKMVVEAEKNDLDWRLLPAIAVRESTGGKHACKKATNSFFGWGSCKINFKSTEEAIETVALNLGGNNPNTDHHYAGKTVKEILQKYNPPSIVKNYAPQVMKIMEAIGPENMMETLAVNS